MSRIGQRLNALEESELPRKVAYVWLNEGESDADAISRAERERPWVFERATHVQFVCWGTDDAQR